MPSVVPTRLFDESNVEWGSLTKVGDHWAMMCSYNNEELYLQTCPVRVVSAPETDGPLVVAVPNESGFADVVESIDSQQLDVVKMRSNEIFAGEVNDDVIEKMYHPNFADGEMTLSLKLGEFRMWNDAAEIVPTEFEEGATYVIVFVVKGIGFGRQVFGGTWGAVQGRKVADPTPPPPPPAPKPVVDFLNDDDDIATAAKAQKSKEAPANRVVLDNQGAFDNLVPSL